VGIGLLYVLVHSPLILVGRPLELWIRLLGPLRVLLAVINEQRIVVVLQGMLL
jgi:hypothetical protein